MNGTLGRQNNNLEAKEKENPASESGRKGRGRGVWLGEKRPRRKRTNRPIDKSQSKGIQFSLIQYNAGAFSAGRSGRVICKHSSPPPPPGLVWHLRGNKGGSIEKKKMKQTLSCPFSVVLFFLLLLHEHVTSGRLRTDAADYPDVSCFISVRVICL